MTDDSDAYVLTIETAGNQSYIFASNKLREQIGASQLVHEATTVWLLDALGWPDPQIANDPAAFHEALRSQERLDQGAASEIVQAPSGRAIVVVRERAAAIAAGRRVTERALRHAPGLDVSCGIAHVGWSAPGSLAEAITLADGDRNRRAIEVPGAPARHLRLPIIADCDTTAFPAAARDAKAPEATEDRAPARSAVARAKRRAAKAGVKRMARALGNVTAGIAANPEQLLGLLERALEDGDRIGWLAVAHADGNGVGELFIKRSGELAGAPNAEYLKTMRELSLQVDEAALAALRFATSELVARDDRGLGASEILPLVPFIVGGDDLTVLLAGADALGFVCAYLRAAAEAKLVCRAGVAFVKPHFPLHSAYALSSDLADSAKAAKAHGVPAFDFHVLYDTGVPDLEAIREAMLADGGKTRLHGRPYVLADPSPAAPWVEQHRYAHVEHAPAAADERGESGERLLPRSQLAALRGALQHGHRIADQQLRLIAQRYPKGLSSVTAGTGRTRSLFIDTAEESGTRFTRLPDVVDLIELASLRSLRRVASGDAEQEPA